MARFFFFFLCMTTAKRSSACLNLDRNQRKINKVCCCAFNTLFSPCPPAPPSSPFLWPVYGVEHSPCLVSVMNSTLSSTNKTPCNCGDPPTHPSHNCKINQQTPQVHIILMYSFDIFKQVSQL